MADPRNNDRSIPGQFYAFDSTSDAADAFVNVRDEWVFARNQNIIMAKGIRRPVFHMRNVRNYLLYDGTARGLNNTELCAIYEPNAGQSDMLISEDVILSPYTQRCVLTVYGFRSNTVAAPKLFPVILPSEMNPRPNPDVSMTINNVALAKHTCTIPVQMQESPVGTHGHRVMRFSLFCETQIDTAGSKTNRTLVETQRNELILNNTPGPLPMQGVIYPIKDVAADPQVLCGLKTSARGIHAQCVREWPTRLEQTEIITTRAIETIMIETMCLYELELSSFDAGAGDI